jgi:hypothetical protein
MTPEHLSSCLPPNRRQTTKRIYSRRTLILSYCDRGNERRKSVRIEQCSAAIDLTTIHLNWGASMTPQFKHSIPVCGVVDLNN